MGEHNARQRQLKRGLARFARIKTWFCNCNARESDYRYNVIGMVSHSDELKTMAHDLCAALPDQELAGLGGRCTTGNEGTDKGAAQAA